MHLNFQKVCNFLLQFRKDKQHVKQKSYQQAKPGDSFFYAL